MLPPAAPCASSECPHLANDLAARKVDPIVTFGDPAIRAVQQTTSRIPIVGMADDLPDNIDELARHF